VLLDTLVTGLPLISCFAGTYLLFRILADFDLTTDGSYTMGAAVSAVMLLHGVPAVIALICGAISGAVAGMVTATLHTVLRVPILLAGLIMSLALFSINLMIMGIPTLSLLSNGGIFSSFASLPRTSSDLATSATLLGVDLLILGLLMLFLRTEIGLGIRATGINPTMAAAQGVSRTVVVFVALGMANGLVALGGALMAQVQGFVDINGGTGALISGAGAVLLGELLFRPSPSKLGRAMLAVLVGGVLYRLVLVVSLRMGLPATDLKLVTALTVILAVITQLVGRKLGDRLQHLRTPLRLPRIEAASHDSPVGDRAA
jgi:putative ABC transport system permease protein